MIELWDDGKASFLAAEWIIKSILCISKLNFLLAKAEIDTLYLIRWIVYVSTYLGGIKM